MRCSTSIFAGALSMVAATFIACLFATGEIYGYKTQIHAAGEMIEWEINPIPPGRINDLNLPGVDCYENHCTFVLVNPSWSAEYTLSAKISTQLHYNDLRELSIGYYSTSSPTMRRGLETKMCGYFAETCTIEPAITISSLPDDAGSLDIQYIVNGGTHVTITINIAYMDGRNPAMYGGPGENSDTFFCSGNAQPGKPRMVRWNRSKGAGPGG
jgi:hypothetical protein